MNSSCCAPAPARGMALQRSFSSIYASQIRAPRERCTKTNQSASPMGRAGAERGTYGAVPAQVRRPTARSPRPGPSLRGSARPPVDRALARGPGFMPNTLCRPTSAWLCTGMAGAPTPNPTSPLDGSDQAAHGARTDLSRHPSQRQKCDFPNPMTNPPASPTSLACGAFALPCAGFFGRWKMCWRFRWWLARSSAFPISRGGILSRPPIPTDVTGRGPGRKPSYQKVNIFENHSKPTP